MKVKRTRIDWDNIKVTFIGENETPPNPHNPYSELSQEERINGLIRTAAQILNTHSLKSSKNKKTTTK